MTRTITASILVGSLLLLRPGSRRRRFDGKECVRDSMITTKIKAELAAQKIASLIEVNVDTDQDKAVAIASGIAGVTSVRIDIKVGIVG